MAVGSGAAATFAVASGVAPNVAVGRADVPSTGASAPPNIAVGNGVAAGVAAPDRDAGIASRVGKASMAVADAAGCLENVGSASGAVGEARIEVGKASCVGPGSTVVGIEAVASRSFL